MKLLFTLSIVLCLSSSCMADATLDTTFFDPDGRNYLEDIRQVELWIVGLILVHLTVHGWKV